MGNTNIQKKKKNISPIIVFILLLIEVIIIFIPYIWGLLSTLKSTIEFDMDCLSFPKKITFENYLNAFKNLAIEVVIVDVGKMKVGLVGFFINSISYAIISSFFFTLATYLVAYACTMCRFRRFSRIIEVFVIVTMALPIYGSLPAGIRINKAIGTYDNFIFFTTFASMSFSSIYFFVMETCLKGVTPAFREAAKIDGATNVQILFRVMFPLTVSVFATIFLIVFVTRWNDYTTCLVYLKSYPTLSYALWVFNNDSGKGSSHVVMKLTAAFIVAVPIVILFSIFHKSLMNGVSLSEGVKE